MAICKRSPEGIKSEINTSDEKMINVPSLRFFVPPKSALWLENFKPDLSKSQVG